MIERRVTWLAASVTLLVLSAWIAGCDDGPTEGDAAADGGRDGGRRDAAMPGDGGTLDGASEMDASLEDAAPEDGAPEDGALGDGALGDGALGDAALGDGALGDAALGDAALEDAALAMDGGPPPRTCLDLGTPTFTPVVFSCTDVTDNVVLSANRLEVESRGMERGGARSDGVVMPGSGVYYYEAEVLGDVPADWGFGVATAAEDLTAVPGRSAESVGFVTYSGYINDEIGGSPGGRCDAMTLGWGHEHVGFAVDYRGANPIVYFVIDTFGTLEIGATCTMTGVTAPLHIFYAGWRWSVGTHGRINAGNDTTNFPFFFDETALRAALETEAAGTGTALVMGWGQTRARPLSTPPVLTAPPDTSVAVGTPITLMATATDAEDGDLGARIVWADLATNHFAPDGATGPSYTLTPTTIGRHPIRVQVRDDFDVLAEATVMLTVTGTVPVTTPTRLIIEPGTGHGMTLSSDGLGVRFSSGHKDAILANQGNYGHFWYFEAHRESASEVYGGAGISVRDGQFSPYDFFDPPWSMSVNVGGDTWENLISQNRWDDVVSSRYYGFAVDYRGEHPIVYVIIGDRLVSTLTLTQTWVTVYPMLYGGTGTSAPAPGNDMSINFGASAFHYDPVAILTAASVDASGLELRWGP